jgi:hypothetical protein
MELKTYLHVMDIVYMIIVIINAFEKRFICNDWEALFKGY